MSGTIIPNHRLNAMGDREGGSKTVQVITNVDARGASVEAVTELRQMLARRDAELPTRVMQVFRDAGDRGLM